MAYESNFDYNGSVSKITKVRFGIMNDEKVRKQSVVEVIHHDTFCGNEPVIGGLFDPRMGVLEYGQICSTDLKSNKSTPGYFGHIELSVPIFHVQYFPIVQKVLKCVCYRCCELLHTSDGIEKKNKLSYVIEQSKKVKKCPNCDAIQPDKYIKTDLCKVHGLWNGSIVNNVQIEETKLDMTSEYTEGLFNKMSDDTCESIGFNKNLSHPKWMIMRTFPVCPPSCRPSVHQDNGQRMEDDITIKYCDIIKYNNFIREKMKTDPNAKILEDWHNILQYHCSTLIDNEIAGVLPAAQRSGRPLKGLRQRLKGKEGRIRGNLMGKRVNFSSRTVITPDPVIDIDELGVPKKIAVQLTYPEKVTKNNISYLKKCVRNGTSYYPGARAVYKKKSGKTISLNHIDKIQFSKMVEIGDIVIRHIKKGDWVIFNRQPSLHKMSMMAHRVRILDGLTFRLNISATTPYNADFDGDEMNMHVPQSVSSENEIATLASVNKQIISPALNMPIITFVQDAVLGGHIMTMDCSTRFSRGEMMNALSITKTNMNLLNNDIKESYSGCDALSYCIPDITVNLKNRRGQRVIIRNGKILEGSGNFDKKVFTSLIHSIFRDKGSDACAKFFNNAQHVIRAYLIKNSFSVGIRDLVLDKDFSNDIDKEINQQKLEVEKTIQTIHLNIFENLTSYSERVAFENKVTQQLTAARSAAENLLKNRYDNINSNRFMNMVDGGSKGKLINLAQMTACLGQQIIEGKRVPYGFDFRTLPHYTKYDDTSEARGFVHSSFQRGMNSLEFFFHAMAGREGIIDTAVKTSSTGYIQRKLMKALEDYKISWSKNVKDAQGNIVQFLYGDDNVDGISFEFQSVPIIEVSDFDSEYKMSGLDVESNKLMDVFYKDFKEMKDWYVKDIFGNSPEGTIKYPVHIVRTLNSCLCDNQDNSCESDKLTVKYILSNYEFLFSKLKIHSFNEGTWMFKFMIYNHAHPKKLIETMKISVNEFNKFLVKVYELFIESQIEAGDAVGPVAAQSIGEPCTQLTLNTFHLSGVGGKSTVTRGVPRLQELFHLSKNPKNPSLTVYVKSNINKDKSSVQRVSAEIGLIRVCDFVTRTDITYEKYNSKYCEFEDFNETFAKLSENKIKSDWYLNLYFNKKVLLDKHIEMEDIYYSILKLFEDSIKCTYSDDNSIENFIRISVDPNNSEFKKGLPSNNENIIEIAILRHIESKLMGDLIVRGVDGIENVTLRQELGPYSEKEWLIDTVGSNVLDVILHPDVDMYRTVSNDIHEMYQIFGIEGARNALIREIREVMDEASEIDPRHIHLLVDMMTKNGMLIPIDRNGMKLTDVGPLAKCSFEEADQQLYKAAINAESDMVSGVSSNIIFGQAPPCGTGTVNVKLDEEYYFNLKNTELNDNSESDENEEIMFDVDD
tara:strand:+ start:132 stop:4352 length:4221 start_codon:yes stop_codon:yes gene_type:complete